VVTERPTWGDARDLLRLMDVEEVAPGRFVGPPYPTPRNVVEGGQLLGEAIVAASKTVPGQRVVTAHMIFAKAASFDDPLDVAVEVLRRGRTFSTVEVRISQLEQLRSAGLLLLDAGAPDAIRGWLPMPEVKGPDEAVPYDFGVTGRDLRVIDAAYDADPEQVGAPEICTWVRFDEDPGEPYLHQALAAQSATHWTIAAAMRPHKGIGEVQAHRTLSTGIMSISLAFHDEVDVTDWLLYVNPSTYAGRGLAQGDGHVWAQDGRLVASYTVQATIRGFDRSPESMGMDWSNVM
jgi:acyl-CoA thioesterase